MNGGVQRIVAATHAVIDIELNISKSKFLDKNEITIIRLKTSR
jgi:hypothetical protein